MVYGTKPQWQPGWTPSSARCSLSWMTFYKFNLCLWPVGNVFAWTVGDAEGCSEHSQGPGVRHRNWVCSEEPAAPWAWPQCPCCLLAVPGYGGWLCCVLWLLSALGPEGWAQPSRASPGVEPWNTFALPCSLQQGLLLDERWIGNVSAVPDFVQAGVAGMWEVIVKTTDSCTGVPGACWE